jgi:hypothetical protein
MSSSSKSASGTSRVPARWRRGAVIGLVAIVLLLAIAILLLLTIDLGRFKDAWADAASAGLERKLHIEGTLSIRVGRRIEIVASDVVIENADWAGDAPLLRIGSLAAEVDAMSLFSRTLDFKRLEMADMRLELVGNDAGEVNWQLGGESDELSEYSYAFESVTLTDFVASIASPALTDSLSLRVASLEHTIRDGRLVDRVDGTINDTQLFVEGSIGPRSSILEGGPATFDYTGRLGEIAFDAAGSFDDIHAPREPLVEFSLTGPDAQYLFRLLNLPESARGALALEGRLGRVADRIEFAARGQVGEFTLDATGWTSDLRTLADGEVEAEAAGPDLDRVASVFGIDGLPQAAFNIRGTSRKSGDEVDVDSLTLAVGGSRIELQGRMPSYPGITGTELALTARGDDLSLFGDLPSSPYTASATGVCTDNRIRLSEARVTIGDARMGLAGDVEPAGRETRVNLAIEASVPDLEALLDSFGVDGAPALRTEVAARVEHRGGATRMTDIDGRLGELEFTGSLALEGRDAELTAVVDAAVHAPRLDRLLPATPAFAAAAIPVDAEISASLSGSRLQLSRTNATLGETRLSVQGTVENIRDVSGLDLLVKATSPDLAALGSSERFAIPALPLSMAGSIKGSPDAWSATDVLTVLGNSRFQASLRYANGDPLDIGIEARAERIDLRDVLPEPAPRVASARQPRDRVIPDVEFPVDLLNRVNLAATVRTDQLVSHRLDFRDVVLDGTIRDGAVHINTIDLRGPRGHVVGEIDYRPADGGWLLESNLKGDSLVIAKPGEQEDVVRARPTFELESGLSARGTGLREILASLDGHTLVHGGRGVIPDTGGIITAIFFGDFATQLLDAVNPFTRTQETIRIRCAVLMLDFDDGIVAGDPALVMQTGELNIFARGQVDLGSEAVEISINTAARKGIGLGFSDIVSPYTIVRGTLASPTLTLSEKDVLFRGGAAVATGGLTILARGLKNRFLADKEPCETALNTYRKAVESSE